MLGSQVPRNEYMNDRAAYLKSELLKIAEKYKDQPEPPRATKEWFIRKGDRMRYESMLKEYNEIKHLPQNAMPTDLSKRTLDQVSMDEIREIFE